MLLQENQLKQILNEQKPAIGTISEGLRRATRQIYETVKIF